ncbi:class I SAM-dependent methyltransferase [Gammaproteobacteria bacterium]|nr:class I SAM-dependent methyltransferase [Gammaproteobacteria bacterium]
MNTKRNDSIPEDYINVIYGEDVKPLTSYPSIFTKYLFKRYDMKYKAKLLDFGCGRGEFLKGFIDMGVEGHGVDFTNAAKKFCPNAEIKQADIENDGLPYPDNYFDIVFSKSVIEHFHNPDILVKEIHRCLKPGGLAIILAPSWEYCYRIYFEDYTHRTPFMKTSLNDILLIHGFKDVEVSFFKQLPILWGNFYWIFNPLSFITRLVTPIYFSKYFKWVRFSKEIMLLSASRKPIND